MSGKAYESMMHVILAAVQDGLKVTDGGFASHYFTGPASKKCFKDLEEEFIYALHEASADRVGEILRDYIDAEIEHRKACARGFRVSVEIGTDHIERTLGQAGIRNPAELLEMSIEKEFGEMLNDALNEKRIAGDICTDPVTHRPEVQIERW